MPLESDKKFITPVLFIVFSKLDATKQVFQAIREAKPPRLYVAADGPRLQVKSEKEKTETVRNFILSNIDWNCEVKTLFSNDNLGCMYGPSKAIKWFFSQEESGIVLEDDCLPDNSFFWFCQELLERYKNDARIGLISGLNIHNTYPCHYSYHFSIGGPTWGWASWKRVGEKFDPLDPLLKSPDIFRYLINATTDPNESEHLFNNLQRILKGEDTQSWDFQWGILLKINSQLAIVPSKNLIKNIGLTTPEATHPLYKKNPFADIQLQKIDFPLKHPECIIADRKFSMILGADHYPPAWRRFLTKIPFLKLVYKGLFIKYFKKLKYTPHG